MVASISARKSVSAAVAYFKHLEQDEYYTAEDESETEGDWERRSGLWIKSIESSLKVSL